MTEQEILDVFNKLEIGMNVEVTFLTASEFLKKYGSYWYYNLTWSWVPIMDSMLGETIQFEILDTGYKEDDSTYMRLNNKANFFRTYLPSTVNLVVASLGYFLVSYDMLKNIKILNYYENKEYVIWIKNTSS